MKMNRQSFDELANILFDGNDTAEVPTAFHKAVMRTVIKDEIKQTAERLYPNHKIPSNTGVATIAKELGRNANQVAYYISELICEDKIFNWEWQSNRKISTKVNDLLNKTFAEKNVQYMDIYTLAELFDMTVNSIIVCVGHGYCEKYFLETLDCYDERGRRIIYVKRYKNR